MCALLSPIDTVLMPTIEESNRRLRLVKPRRRLLSVSGLPLDHEVLAGMIDGDLWDLAVAGSSWEAFVQLRRLAPLIVFCESLLPDGTWRDVFEHAQDLTAPPLVVVTSTVADDYLWSEVLNLGGYDMLVKPFSKDDVDRVLAAALCTLNRLHRTPAA